MCCAACRGVLEVSQQSTLICMSQPALLVNKKGTTVCFMFQSKVYNRGPHNFTATKLNVPLKARLNQFVCHNLCVRPLKIASWSPP